jgi:3-phenylpropionate/trans-cinnamate dioxygenase ferredoxin reductase subunit
MKQDERIVIVGASLAGAKAAAALRSEGFEGSITLVGAEKHHPYERPPLSKDYLQGNAERSSVFVKPAEWYAENNVDLRLGVAATGFDAAAQTVTLENGETLPYDALLLATGSSPRWLSIPGSDLDGVHYLRTLDDSEALHKELADGGKKLVLIGSGWIGMELAASANVLGNDVVVLERGPVPLAAALGSELGQFFADLHLRNGVDIRPSVEVTSITGRDGRVAAVSVIGQDDVPADLVVIGIGAVPNIDLAVAAGLETSNGVDVSASLQTSDPHVYAAGDIANAMHPVLGQRLRSEHWQNAISTGEAAAKAILGQDVSFDDIPYFFTDQFDLGMEYSGYAPLTKDARLVYRGDRDTREFVVFWLSDDNRVVAGMNVNVWDVNGEVQRFIRRGTPVDPSALANPDIPLDSL